MAALLALSGYEVATEQTIAGGLRSAKNRSFDLYLLDHRLSDGTGLELCRRIRAFDPHTPILFYSGASREVNRHLALSAGAQAFLVKPEDLEQLEQTIACLISEAEAKMAGKNSLC
jgi:DNA-binding response OmpR family regulator